MPKKLQTRAAIERRLTPAVERTETARSAVPAAHRPSRLGALGPLMVLGGPVKDEEALASANIVHHGQRRSDFEPATGDPLAIQAIGDHIERHLGKIQMVFHEIVSDLVHIDLHWVKPRAGRPFNTLVTSGMSDRPMTTPPEAGGFRFAELLINLPPSWPMTQHAWSDERHYWPVRLLKTLARLPHEYETWLCMDHTIGEPHGEPYHSTTRQNCALIAPCLSAPRDFHFLEISPSKRVNFFSVLPLYPEEVEFKLKHGPDALFDRFETAGVRDGIDPLRPNTVKSTSSDRRGWRKWFRA